MLVTPTWFCRARSLALSHRRARRRIGSRVVAAGVDERRLTAVRLGAVLLATVFMSLGLVHIAPLQAEDLYLSPDGNDQHAGTRTAPLKTLSAARNAARRFAGRQTVTVHVADGIYYLPETLVLGPADSGSQEHPVLYTADHEGAAIISGGSRLDVVWQSSPNGIYRAKTPPDIAIDQLFIDGQRRPMARYPNYDADQPTAAYQGFAADAFSKERAARWSDPTGGYIHAMHRSRWGGYHYRITGQDGRRRCHVRGRVAEQSQIGHAQAIPNGREYLRRARRAGRVVSRREVRHTLLPAGTGLGPGGGYRRSCPIAAPG